MRGIFELYSQNQQPDPGEFVYDKFPAELKTQCIYVWNEYYEQGIPEGIRQEYFKRIAEVVVKEHALKNLPSVLHAATILDRINIYFDQLKDVNRSLDIVQLLCYSIEHLPDFMSTRGFPWFLNDKGDAAIEEINARFKRAGVGYQYAAGKIIRLDKQILHTEAVEKTLQLLADPVYDNVNREFLTAHEHFRHGRNEDAIAWSLKAFESVMKIVATANGWSHDQGATARPLVNLLFTNGFFPDYLQTAMSGLQNFLENSINTIRNKKGGHGSGAVINEVPDSLAQYVLYITGMTINWIVGIQAGRKKPNVGAGD